MTDAPTIIVQGNQEAQHAFLMDWRTGTTCASGGWASGKTWAGARKFSLMHQYNACPGMMVAPSWSDMGRLMVPAIMKVCEEWRWPLQVNMDGRGSNDFPHLLMCNALVYLFTGEKPAAITGVEVGHCWADEAARLKHVDGDPLKSAPTQIRGRLRHPAAKVLHWMNTTTPEGTYTWVQKDFVDAVRARHRIYYLRTQLNKAMRRDALDEILSGIPIELHDQYLAGHAVNYTANKAHSRFSIRAHVDPVRTVQWNNGPVFIGCDFNVAPMCWVAGQKQPDGSLVILDEMVIENHAQVDMAVEVCEARNWGGTALQRREVTVYPDMSSRNRSTTGDPEATVLANTARALGWSASVHNFGVNPPVNSRINNVSRCLMDGKQRVRLFIHPRCKRLIQELDTVGRLANGYDPGPAKTMGHIGDALGYLVWHVFPVAGQAQATNWHL